MDTIISFTQFVHLHKESKFYMPRSGNQQKELTSSFNIIKCGCSPLMIHKILSPDAPLVSCPLVFIFCLKMLCQDRARATAADSNTHILRSSGIHFSIFRFLGKCSHEHHLPLRHPFRITVPMLPQRYRRLPVRRKNLLQRRQSIMAMPE